MTMEQSAAILNLGCVILPRNDGHLGMVMEGQSDASRYTKDTYPKVLVLADMHVCDCGQPAAGEALSYPA